MPLLVLLIAFIVLAGAAAIFLVKHDIGEHEPVSALWAAFGLGVAGIVAALALEIVLVPHFTTDGSSSLGMLAGVALQIAVIEELVKCLPLLVLLYKKRYFNEHTDGVIYFALAGLGFGLPENLLYTLQFGLEVGLLRLVLTPLFHAATTAIIGYALVRHKLDGFTTSRVVGVVVSVIGIHAIYDFGLFSGKPLLIIVSLAITAGLGIGLLALIRRARAQDRLMRRASSNRRKRSK